VSALDGQQGGDHYRALSPQPVEVIHAWGLTFALGNVVKYVARAGRKPGVSALEDLRKAQHYIDLQIELMERDNNI